MSLKETYFGNSGNVRKMDPSAIMIDVTRRAGSVLSPSWEMLNEYKAGKITWDQYIEMFVKEMDNLKSRNEMLRIGELARTEDVYLVCFERMGNCHRFLLVEMIKRLMLDDTCRRVNPFVSDHPDIITSGYDNISKAFRVEA